MKSFKKLTSKVGAVALSAAMVMSLVPAVTVLANEPGGQDAAETQEITVRKEWRDNGEREIESIFVTFDEGENTYEVSASDEWTATMGDMPVYDENGEEIDYATLLREASVPEGYSVSRASVDEDVIVIINAADIEIPVSVEWDDNGEGTELRPESMTVSLNGQAATLSDTNEWTYTFSELPVYDEDGEEIEYVATVTENGEYYSAEVNEDNGGFVITNTCTYEKQEDNPTGVDIEIVKTWEDGNRADRPDEITVELCSEGSVIDTVTITEEDEWMYKFHELDATYSYTIAEIVPNEYVANYEVGYDENGNMFYTIVNYSEEIAEELGVEENGYIDIGLVDEDGNPIDSDESVDTGDIYSIAEIVFLIALIFILVAILVFLVRERNQKMKEENGDNDADADDKKGFGDEE